MVEEDSKLHEDAAMWLKVMRIELIRMCQVMKGCWSTTANIDTLFEVIKGKFIACEALFRVLLIREIGVHQNFGNVKS